MTVTHSLCVKKRKMGLAHCPQLVSTVSPGLLGKGRLSIIAALGPFKEKEGVTIC